MFCFVLFVLESELLVRLLYLFCLIEELVFDFDLYVDDL